MGYGVGCPNKVWHSNGRKYSIYGTACTCFFYQFRLKTSNILFTLLALKWRCSLYNFFNVYMEPLKKAQVEGFLMFAEPEVLFGNLDELCCVSLIFSVFMIYGVLSSICIDILISWKRNNEVLHLVLKKFNNLRKCNFLLQFFFFVVS